MHPYIYIYIYIWTSKFVHSMCVNINNKHASTIYENKYVLYMYMGWLRLVGSFKLQVSFAEYGLFYRALLQKRPIILRSLRIVATTYSKERGMHPRALQHTATHCTTRQSHCNSLPHTATRCDTLQHTSTRCNTLQHTATKERDGQKCQRASVYWSWTQYTESYRYLLQKSPIQETIFCKRDL